MKMTAAKAEIWVPDGANETDALKRVTHLGIAAHQDDIEIMSMEGILEGFGNPNKWFMAVIATNGAGSPRDGLYGAYTDDEMQVVRRAEQKKAAFIGEYSAVAFLDHSSSVMKDAKNPGPKDDIKAIVAATRPEVVYTHNLADKHDTHVSTALRTIAAIRELPADQRPRKLYGCEVWRDLDWLMDDDKVVFAVNGHQNIQASLRRRVRFPDRRRQALRSGNHGAPPRSRHLSPEPRGRCRRVDQLRHGPDAAHSE